MGPADLLAEYGICVASTAPGRYYTTCPKCSAARSNVHKKAECLGVTIEDDSVRWGCNHCGWTGPEKGNGAKPELTTYVYRDNAGAVRFRKVRNVPGRDPRFWLEKPDGRGGWQKGAGGVDTKIVYRCDEVGKAIASGRTICVVEGEKDADNLWRIGFAATCNAHGASQPDKGAKWTKAHSEQLRGADLVVFNDNDPAGYAHAEVTCRLSIGLAKRVRRLDLASHWVDIPKGGDVSDWLADGHDGEELARLIEAAPEHVATEQQEKSRRTEAALASGTDDDAQLTRLARLPLFEYERIRKAAAQGFDMRASMLDRVVGMKRRELGLAEDDGKQGRPIELTNPEPWQDPVDGAALLDNLAAALARHVVMGEHERVAVALWIIHAYLLDRLMISPRLAIRSAVKGSGKTTCLDVLARLVPRPLSAANVSPSAIFRVIAAYAPSLLIDEADTLFRDGDDTLRGVLNAGHRRGGTVLRSVGDSFEPRAFSCYAATAIALIGQLPGTLADRSVDIVLARRRPSDTVEAFRFDRTEHLDQLARQAARWAKDNGERLNADPVMPPGIFNRAADNWRALIAIADAARGAWPEKARAAAIALAGVEIDEVSRVELLLSDIRDIFAASPAAEITSATLIEELIKIVPRPWAEYGKGGKPVTANRLARLLKPLGIGPGLIGTQRLAGYQRAQFEEAFERYLAPKLPLSNLSASQKGQAERASHDFEPLTHDNGREVLHGHKPNNDGVLRAGELAEEDDPICAVCGRPGGNWCSTGGQAGWVHADCESAFVSQLGCCNGEAV